MTDLIVERWTPDPTKAHWCNVCLPCFEEREQRKKALMLTKVAIIVVERQVATEGLLHEHMKVSGAEARDLLGVLEAMGVIGPGDRDVRASPNDLPSIIALIWSNI